MSFSLVKDYESIKKRYAAFWEGEIIDRALAAITLSKDKNKEIPKKEYSSQRDRWLDVEYRAEQIETELENRIYLGDALPIAWPNMGPEIFSAWCGCEYFFGETTTWSSPAIKDWKKDFSITKFNKNHELFLKTVEFTELLLERGKEKFIVGLTDFHPGGDHLAALRDPANLAVDMIESLSYVKQKLKESQVEFFEAYDIFYNMIKENDMPSTSWLPLISEGKYYIPSNDFSIMVSNDMYEEVFLEGIIEECKFYDNSIYHLDGVGALRHLDTLLEINELNAVQFVPGAGEQGFPAWIDVYKKIQSKNKGLWICGIKIDELKLLFDNLKPEGVFLQEISGIDNEDTAISVLKAIERWSV